MVTVGGYFPKSSWDLLDEWEWNYIYVSLVPNFHPLKLIKNERTVSTISVWACKLCVQCTAE